MEIEFLSKRLFESILEVGLSALEQAAAYKFEEWPGDFNRSFLELVALGNLEPGEIDLLIGQDTRIFFEHRFINLLI